MDEQKRKRLEKERFRRSYCQSPKREESFFKGLPSGAIGRVTEVDGKQAWIQPASGEIVPATFKTWVFPGDTFITGKHTVLAAELVTGGRVGINKDVAARVDGNGGVKAVPDPLAPFPDLPDREAREIV